METTPKSTDECPRIKRKTRATLPNNGCIGKPGPNAKLLRELTEYADHFSDNLTEVLDPELKD